MYRDGQAVALLDFDFAAPGRPLWELADMAQIWSPLRPPELVVAGMAHLDPFHRLRVLGDAYRLDTADHREFVDLIIESRRHADHLVRRRLVAREPAFVNAWKPLGGEKALDQILDWFVKSRGCGSPSAPAGAASDRTVISV